MKIILIFLSVLIFVFAFSKWIGFCMDFFDDMAIGFTMTFGVPLAIIISLYFTLLWN